jgi:competence protein ComEC
LPVTLRLFAQIAKLNLPPLGVLAVAACLTLQMLPALPAWTAAELMTVLTLCVITLSLPLRQPVVRACLWLCLWISAQLLLLHQGLLVLAPEAIDRHDLEVNVKIQGLPVRDEQGWRFSGMVLGAVRPSPDLASAFPAAGKLVQITWSAGYTVASSQSLPIDLRPGDIWQLPLRFRSWRSLRNPLASGPPDSRVRAMEEGWWARAQVRTQAGQAQLLAPANAACFTWSCVVQAVDLSRYATRKAILAATSQDASRASGMLIALVLGDQSLISPQDWQRFNRTGIGHLISISGLHVTMIAALGAWCFAALWRHGVRRSDWIASCAEKYCSQGLAGRSGAVLVGAWYCLFAGAQVPAQRTFWMLLALACVTALRRRCNLLLSLSLAAVVVLALDPWAVMSPGFWLSFVATWALMRGMQTETRSSSANWLMRQWRALGAAARAQAIVTLGLIPLSATMFGYFSLVSPVANAFAIPLVSYVVTPLAITGALLHGLSLWLWSPFSVLAVNASTFLWGLASKALTWMMQGLAYLDTQAAVPAVLALAAPATLFGLVSIASAYLGMLLLVMATLWRWRALGLALLLLVFIPDAVWPAKWRAPAIQGLELTLLDTGAGSAVLLRTPDLTILYDTGANAPASGALAGGAGQDQAARILLPYLRERGIHHLDLLVVSHADREHSGGFAAVKKALTVSALVLPNQMRLGAASENAHTCQGADMTTAQTTLEFFQWSSAKNANDASCVLRVQVRTAQHTVETVLLLGDLSVAGQKALTGTWPRQRLQAGTLQMPGQGAKHTWYPEFLAAVAPQFVLLQVPAGHWRGYPLESATAPLQALGADLLRTDLHGAISLRLPAGQAGRPSSQSIWRERLDAPRYFDAAERR